MINKKARKGKSQDATTSWEYVGIDLSKAQIDADLDGKHKVYPNTAAGLDRFRKAVEGLGGKVVVVYESTGWISRRISVYLDKCRIRRCCLTASWIRHHAKSIGRHAKTDKLDYASEINADMIVIMTEQEKALNSWLIGNYAQQMLHLSHIPILTVRPEQLCPNV